MLNLVVVLVDEQDVPESCLPPVLSVKVLNGRQVARSAFRKRNLEAACNATHEKTPCASNMIKCVHVGSERRNNEKKFADVPVGSRQGLKFAPLLPIKFNTLLTEIAVSLTEIASKPALY